MVICVNRKPSHWWSAYSASSIKWQPLVHKTGLLQSVPVTTSDLLLHFKNDINIPRANYLGAQKHPRFAQTPVFSRSPGARQFLFFPTPSCLIVQKVEWPILTLHSSLLRLVTMLVYGCCTALVFLFFSSCLLLVRI